MTVNKKNTINRKKYLRLGIKLLQKLIDLHPVRVIKTSPEGRENAKMIEKKWLSSLKNFKFNKKLVCLVIPKKNYRFWFDLALIHGGQFFPCNFKSASGNTQDNISGLKYIRYLIFYDLDSKYKLRAITEKELARKIVQLKKKKIRLDNTNRDYFCISHCYSDRSIKILPISCVRSSDLVTNPKNLFQCNFHNAKVDLNRSLEKSVNFLIKKFIDYSKKRAEIYMIFKKNKII